MPDAGDAEPGWATPGVTIPRPAAVPADDVVALTAALDAALAVHPSLLPPEDAVARAETLLAAQDRLAAAALRAVADVEERDLWRERSAGSTRTWLRTLPCGDRGQLTASRLWRTRPVLAGAVEAGAVALRTAVAVARELDRLPAHVEEDQLSAVLVDGAGELLSVWAGAACLEPTAAQELVFEQRRDELASVVRSALIDCWSDPAGRLEPVLALAARVLTPAEVEAGAAVLVDALLPVPEVDAAAEQLYVERGLTLRKLSRGGWSLRAHLTDEVGQLAYEQLVARTRRAKGRGEAEAHRETDVGDGGTSDAQALDAEQRYGSAGPGTPIELGSQGEQGTPQGTRDQQWHDAFAQLLHDLAGVRPGSGAPAAGTLTLIASVEALEGRPGAPPGRLRTAGGDVRLSPAQLRNAGCRSVLAAVLLDARGRPVGASGTHRHATARERRTMRAVWGSGCGVNGCGLPGDVPHHAEPFWKSTETVQKDLVPVCEHHHHDVHEGHKTLRLRDGRLLDEWGWVSATRTAQARRAG